MVELHHHFIVEGCYAILIDWIIWNTAEPHTTKMKSANSHGPTGYDSFSDLTVLGTLPRLRTFFIAFSLAKRILCTGAMVYWCLS